MGRTTLIAGRPGVEIRLTGTLSHRDAPPGDRRLRLTHFHAAGIVNDWLKGRRMSTATPPRPRSRRRRFVLGLMLVLLGFVMATSLVGLNQFLHDGRQKQLVADIESGHGQIIRETSRWDRWVGQLENSRSGGPMYRETDGAIVRLEGVAFSNQWIRDREYLRELPISTLCLNRSEISGTDLALLVGAHSLRELYAADVELSPEVFDGILQQSRLKHLHLRGADLQDEQFVRLPLERIEQISIEQTRVTPVGLRDLRRCGLLGCLGLDGRQLDDETAAALSRMPRLHSLTIVGPEASDEHAQRLHGLPRLRRLMLVGTSISPTAVQALQQSFPDCFVESL